MASLIDLPDRLQDKIVVDCGSGCWWWTGARDSNGYGRTWMDGSHRKAPRLIYELLVEKIPDGLVPDHLCENKACVNPGHLETVTQRENVRRWYARFTHCKHGHEFTPENLLPPCPSNDRRRCRECKRIRDRKKR